MNIFKRSLVLGLVAGLGVALPAHAQLSRDGGRTQISADRLDVAERESKAIYTGAVDAIQGDARLRSDKLTINFAGTGDSPDGGGFGAIENMLAEGNVYYITPDLQARGDKGTYNDETDVIVLTGKVVISRGSDIAEGECLRLKVETGESTLGCTGKGENGKPTGRVRTILTPTNNGDDE